MKTNAIFSLLAVFFALSLFFACTENNDDDAPDAHDDAVVDAFVMKRSNQYGLVLYADARAMQSCTVLAHDGAQYELEPYWKTNSRRYMPGLSDFEATKPSDGSYRFELRFDDGAKKILYDDLGNTDLDAISAATIAHSMGAHATSISWSTLDSVDEYALKLLDKHGYVNQPLFYQAGFTIDDNAFYLDSTTLADPGWNPSAFPAFGDSCYLVIEAWKNEVDGEGDQERNRDFLIERTQLVLW